MIPPTDPLIILCIALLTLGMSLLAVACGVLYQRVRDLLELLDLIATSRSIDVRAFNHHMSEMHNVDSPEMRQDPDGTIYA